MAQDAQSLAKIINLFGVGVCLAARPIGGKFLRTELNPPREVWNITLGVCMKTAAFLVQLPTNRLQL